MSNFSGTYYTQGQFGSIQLTLVAQGVKRYQGSIQGGGIAINLNGRLLQNELVGTALAQDTKFSFVVTQQANGLLVKLMEVDAQGKGIAATVRNIAFGRQPVATQKPSPPQRKVVINQIPISEAQLQQIEAQYHFKIPDGIYWYDARCGAWGMAGEPTLGFTTPNLNLGGTLQPNASNGTTGVFINGRQLHQRDVMELRKVLPVVMQGRYFLDKHGSMGFEGGLPLINLYSLINNQQHNNFYHSSITGTTISSSGSSGHISGDGFSYAWGM